MKTRISLTVLAVAAAIFLLRYMQEVCVPMALAVLLFYALDRPVDFLQRWHIPRVIGAALVLGLFAGSIAGIGYVVQDEALAVVNHLPESARKLRQILRRSPTAEPGTLDKVDEAAKELQEQPIPARRDVMRVQVEDPPFRIGNYLWWGSMNAVTFANQVVMILFLTYFMLLSNDLFKRKIVEVAPTLTRKKVSLEILDEIAAQIERFLVIQFMMSVVVAAMTALTLWWLGLEQALFWGIVAGVFNSIPYYGPLIVSVVLSVVAFIQFETLGMTAAVTGVALAVTTLEGFLLTPALMGRAARINQVSMFAGLLFWTWMWGVWGLLLAVPLMMVIKVVSDRVEGLEQVGRFLGE